LPRYHRAGVRVCLWLLCPLAYRSAASRTRCFLVGTQDRGELSDAEWSGERCLARFGLRSRGWRHFGADQQASPHPTGRTSRPWGHGDHGSRQTRPHVSQGSDGRIPGVSTHGRPGKSSLFRRGSQVSEARYTGAGSTGIGASAMGSRRARQYYCRCGTHLAKDNTERQCARCQRASRDKLITPPEVSAEFWQTDQFRDAFAAQHIGRVARAYRTHPYHHAVYGPSGISQTLLGQWLGLRQPQVSQIETGPPIRDLDTLTYWARTLRYRRGCCGSGCQPRRASVRSPNRPSASSVFR